MLKHALALGLIAASLAASARADPGYYVVTPYEREGLASAEVRYWTVKPDAAGEATWPELAVGYGVNSRWTTLLLASWLGEPSKATKLNAWSWQNEVLLTQGELPVDIGAHLALVRTVGEYAGDAAEYGPVLQTEFGPTQVNFNLIFDRARRGGAWQRPNLKYQWQLRRHGTPALNVGLQGFGELGPWDRWAPHDRQSHRAGPALFGTLLPGDRRAVDWQAALLFGRTYAQSGRMLSLRAVSSF
jgi:hypothetical protein